MQNNRCITGKIKYGLSTAREVLEEARKARLRGEMWRSEIRYYKCKSCGAFHLTGQLKRYEYE